jgi:glutathione synthase/RimK-type ligase-like ATP-grasp enzyme
MLKAFLFKVEEVSHEAEPKFDFVLKHLFGGWGRLLLEILLKV